jgi:hypothetical protein
MESSREGGGEEGGVARGKRRRRKKEEEEEEKEEEEETFHNEVTGERKLASFGVLSTQMILHKNLAFYCNSNSSTFDTIDIFWSSSFYMFCTLWDV